MVSKMYVHQDERVTNKRTLPTTTYQFQADDMPLTS